jgi:hypothetical protein
MHPLFLQVANSDGEVVSEHAFSFGIQQNGSQKCTCFFTS